eukprot:2351784-Heterocapsa_arctica.AAC.1
MPAPTLHRPSQTRTLAAPLLPAPPGLRQRSTGPRTRAETGSPPSSPQCPAAIGGHTTASYGPGTSLTPTTAGSTPLSPTRLSRP